MPSSIQRAAGAENAVAKLVTEWACEVVSTNLKFLYLLFKRVCWPGFLRHQGIRYENVPEINERTDD